MLVGRITSGWGEDPARKVPDCDPLLMDHQLGVGVRPMSAVVGHGILRGAWCGAALGASTGAGFIVRDGLTPAAPGAHEDPFSVFLLVYAAVIGALVGVVVGSLASAAAVAALAVAEVVGRRRSRVASVVAAVLAALVSVVALNAFAHRADGVLLPVWQALVVGLGSAAVAWWQVRRLVRPLR